MPIDVSYCDHPFKSFSIVNMDIRYSLLLVIFAFSLTIAQMGDIDDMVNQKKKYCGAQLSGTLSTICKGNYYNIHHKNADQSQSKRSYWDTPIPTYMFQSRTAARTMLTRLRRKRSRGVVNECCENPCTQEELAGYCEINDRRRRRRRR